LTWQERLLNSGIPKTPEFKQKMTDMAADDAIRGYTLMDDDKPIAYVLIPMYEGNRIYFDHTGFDPEYRSWSPGMVLQYKLVELFFNNKQAEVYDLSDGESIMKQTIANNSHHCAIVYFFRFKPSFIAMALAASTLKVTTRFIGRVLERWDLKEKVKRFIRTRA